MLYERNLQRLIFCHAVNNLHKTVLLVYIIVCAITKVAYEARNLKESGFFTFTESESWNDPNNREGGRERRFAMVAANRSLSMNYAM